MMPRAKMVSRRKLPPLNISMNPKIPPAFCWKYSCSRLKSTPGVGMCPPNRYTANKPNVKKMRFRRSGIRNILAIVSKSFIWSYLDRISELLASDHVSTAAGLLELFQSRFRKYVRPHFNLAGDVSGAEHFEPGA